MARGTRAFGRNKGAYGKELEAMREEFNQLVDEVDELKTKLAAHTHGGVTVGAGSTAAPATITYSNPEAAKVT